MKNLNLFQKIVIYGGLFSVLTLGFGCNEQKPLIVNIQNYEPAKGYDVKFGQFGRRYALAIGKRQELAFKNSYIYAEDINKDGVIDYFQVRDRNDKICFDSQDNIGPLENCDIDSDLKSLVSLEKLTQLERGLLQDAKQK